MKNSARHHYLPVFFLNGFANEDGKLVIYDKLEDRFIENQSPENWFHVRNMNRAKLGEVGEHSLEESVLNAIDGRHGLLFHYLRTRPLATTLDSMSTIDKLDLLFFAMVLFWRHPDGGKDFLGLFDEIGVRSDYFSFAELVDIDAIGEAEVREGYRRFLADPEWQKLSKFMVPFSKGIMRDLDYHFDHFRMYPIDQVDDWFFICGDRPMAVKPSPDPSKRLFDGYALPLSSRRALVVVENAPAFLDATLLAQININIIQQSNRFVACGNERFLRFIVGKHKALADIGHAGRLSSAMFKHIAWQASFASYEDYVRAFEERVGRFAPPVF